jgi:hypothetical protein
MAAAAISRQSVFGMRIMTGGSDVPSPVTRFVPVEVVETLLPALRQRPAIPLPRIEAVVDVAVKAARAVKPGAGPNKYAAHKPIGPIVPVWSTAVGFVIEVPVRAHWSQANANRDLGMDRGCKADQGGCDGGEGKSPKLVHILSNARIELQIERASFPLKRSCNLNNRVSTK